jgi:tetratricopeptide (TPR) repeat protein
MFTTGFVSNARRRGQRLLLSATSALMLLGQSAGAANQTAIDAALSAGAGALPATSVSASAGDATLKALLQTNATAWDREYNLGGEALERGFWQSAQQHFLAAIRELKKTNIKDERLLKTRNLLGKAYLKDNKLLDAAEAFQLAQQTANDLHLGQTVESARALEGLGTVAAKSGQFARAEQLYKQALTIREQVQGETSPGIANCLLDLAELLHEQKLFDEAQPYYELALNTLNKADGVSDLSKAYCLDKVGQFFVDRGDMPAAHSFFTASVMLKDKFCKTFIAGDPHARGLVYYRCNVGAPNSMHSFARGTEVECMQVKEVTAMSTLTSETFAHDWYLLKAQITIQNQGKEPISAMAEQPTLTLESPKLKTFLPLDSTAIANELGVREDRLFYTLLHSADYDYVLNSFTVGGATTAAITPFGPAFFNTVGAWATYTPDWAARARAAEAAFASVAQSQALQSSVVSTQPAATTIAPGESETYVIYYPYNSRFNNATLRVLVGNTVMEFPFTSKSG